MRITHDSLMKIASERVTRRVRQDRSITAVYICGSLLQENFLLGGTADIDLFFVHAQSGAPQREIVRLTDEVHLDIAHHTEQDYREPRRLRTHPWLGPVLNNCKTLYDPQHFMDFTQASVRGQFDSPENVLKRASAQVEQARRIWFSYQEELTAVGPLEILAYLRAVGHAANSLASLNGPPLSERRLLLNFPTRAELLERPGLYAGLLGLLGAPNLETNSLGEWLAAWESAYLAVPEDATPARLHPDRRLYYLAAFNEMLNGQQPETILWPMLRTWTMAVDLLPSDAPGRMAWTQAFTQLGILGQGFTERLQALDAYLDLVDETLETWASHHGAWAP